LKLLYPILFITIITICEIGHYSFLAMSDHFEYMDMSGEENSENESKEKKIEDLKKTYEELMSLYILDSDSKEKINPFRYIDSQSQYDHDIQLPPPEES